MFSFHSISIALIILAICVVGRAGVDDGFARRCARGGDARGDDARDDDARDDETVDSLPMATDGQYREVADRDKTGTIAAPKKTDGSQAVNIQLLTSRFSFRAEGMGL